MVPEQRVLQFATIGAEQVAGVQPSDADVAAYYKANAASYASTPQRVVSQATVADAKAAAGIAERARSGASFAAAAAPAGVAAADTNLGVQTLQQYRGLVGDEAAKALFAAPKGGVIGPVKTQFGWTVAKVEDIRDQQGKTLEQAKPEIVAALVETKRKDALAELVGKVEDSIADGASLAEAAKANHLTLVETPPLLAQGVSRSDPAYQLPAQFKNALKSGFSLGVDEEPVVEGDSTGTNYTLVGVGRVIPAAPAPLAEIKDRVRTDWIKKEAMGRARAVAQDMAAKVAKGMSVADAAKAAGGKAQVRPITARRLQLSQVQPDAAVPLRMMFSLAEGKSRMAADPQGRGFFVIKTDKIVPGNAVTQPGLIVETQKAFSQTLGQELAQQFIGAVRAEVKVKRDEKAIKAAQARITGAAVAE
jgi:peptidyl-prolyl cis-trans isomerase D